MLLAALSSGDSGGGWRKKSIMPGLSGGLRGGVGGVCVVGTPGGGGTGRGCDTPNMGTAPGLLGQGPE